MKTLDRIKVIAEAGVNHNGSIDLALELVDEAAKAGADYVKFQVFDTNELAKETSKKAEYQLVGTSRNEGQFNMLKRLELTHDQHKLLVKRCQEKNISYLSSAFDAGSLEFLQRDLGLKTLKLGSGELTNAPLLLQAARSGMKIILSTGMSTISEIEEALAVLSFGMRYTGMPKNLTQIRECLFESGAYDVLAERVVLLHCTTEYPASAEDTNLRVIESLRSCFGLEVGYSDHTNGNAISFAAIALGATIIEKHFTLDRSLEGPDHAASLEPTELKQLVDGIHKISSALGDGIKRPMPSEIKNRKVARKYLVAAKQIPKGKTITQDDFKAKRGDVGVPPINLWQIIGMTTKHEIALDETFNWDMIC